MKILFTLPVRVYYEDTDAGGVVYHANYLKFLERARSEYLFQAGINKNPKQVDVHLVVTEILIKYLSPAYLGDKLEVHLKIKKINRSSVVFLQEIIHPLHAQRICEAEVTTVCMNHKLEIMRMPPELTKIFTE